MVVVVGAMFVYGKGVKGWGQKNILLKDHIFFFQGKERGTQLSVVVVVVDVVVVVAASMFDFCWVW